MNIRSYTSDDLDGLVSICMDTWIVPEEYGDRLRREMSEYFVLGM